MRRDEQRRAEKKKGDGGDGLQDEVEDDLTLALDLVEPSAIDGAELRLRLDAVVEDGVDLRERVHLSRCARTRLWHRCPALLARWRVQLRFRGRPAGR